MTVPKPTPPTANLLTVNGTKKVPSKKTKKLTHEIHDLTTAVADDENTVPEKDAEVSIPVVAGSKFDEELFKRNLKKVTTPQLDTMDIKKIERSNNYGRSDLKSVTKKLRFNPPEHLTQTPFQDNEQLQALKESLEKK